MGQGSLFSRAEITSMRDRARSRNYSAAREEFRREHERHRAWGLQRRHAEKLRRLRGSEHAPTIESGRPQPAEPPTRASTPGALRPASTRNAPVMPQRPAGSLGSAAPLGSVVPLLSVAANSVVVLPVVPKSVVVLPVVPKSVVVPTVVPKPAVAPTVVPKPAVAPTVVPKSPVEALSAVAPRSLGVSQASVVSCEAVPQVLQAVPSFATVMPQAPSMPGSFALLQMPAMSLAVAPRVLPPSPAPRLSPAKRSWPLARHQEVIEPSGAEQSRAAGEALRTGVLPMGKLPDAVLAADVLKSSPVPRPSAAGWWPGLVVSLISSRSARWNEAARRPDATLPTGIFTSSEMANSPISRRRPQLGASSAERLPVAAPSPGFLGPPDTRQSSMPGRRPQPSGPPSVLRPRLGVDAVRLSSRVATRRLNAPARPSLPPGSCSAHGGYFMNSGGHRRAMVTAALGESDLLRVRGGNRSAVCDESAQIRAMLFRLFFNSTWRVWIRGRVPPGFRFPIYTLWTESAIAKSLARLCAGRPGLAAPL
jgi:hypothetical protein